VQQVVVQVPFEVGGLSTVTVTITTGGGGSTAISNVPVQPFAPGIYETTAFGAKQATATHADGSYATPSSGAHRSENTTIYLTGLGETNPFMFTNTRAAAGQRVVAPVTVTLNGSGVPIATDSSGQPMVYALPGEFGVYSVTFQVPPDASSGNAQIQVKVFDASGNAYSSQTSVLPIQ
jgi:uncharacterized protein (TIGR03437 family)